MRRYICIHSHFYQPPRENPWLEKIEQQYSAYPYHDWNERIAAECYAPNTASRILDHDKRIKDIVNNYSKISFNFGPTLLSWMQTDAPETYRAVIEADRISQSRFSGHGSAISQAYNHMIMPLANSRDKRTQVAWGIKDFKFRFGRDPEGMWLPETAVDLETLEILADLGIRFTILAPHQASRMRKIGDKKWQDVSGGKIDPRIPYLCNLPSGRTVSVFFYDGPIARDVAFGGLLKSGDQFAKRLLGVFSEEALPQLVHIATDGETYGHHHRHGDMALAYCLDYIESNNLAEITIYGDYLGKHPPEHQVEIIENTSWSCAHGVERWKNDCGCTTGVHPGWNQAWRSHLREALDQLRDALIPLYERETAPYVKDPWEMRDDYIDCVLDRSIENLERFFSMHARKELSKEEKVKVLKLLEMQRHAMLMYTSCGWFFEDISGIETTQVIQYATRAMQLAGDISGENLESSFVKILERAPSNIPEIKDGGRVYELFVRPLITDLLRVCTHYAVSSIFEEYPQTIKIYSYTIKSEIYEREEVGKQKLAIGKAKVQSEITLEEEVINFAVLYFGDNNLNGGAQKFSGDALFSVMCSEIKDAFLKPDIPGVIRLMDTHLGTHSFSLWHLFRDEQIKVLSLIQKSVLEEMEVYFRQIYERHYPTMHVMDELRIPLPKPFAYTAEFILNTDLRRLLEKEELDLDQLQKGISEFKKWHFELDKSTLSFVATSKINALMERFARKPEDLSLMENIEATLKILGALPLELDLWKAQNVYFSIGKELLSRRCKEAENDPAARRWVELFDCLGGYLHVKSA